MLAEHLSAETKAKLKQSRSMKNYAQGLNFLHSNIYGFSKTTEKKVQGSINEDIFAEMM